MVEKFKYVISTLWQMKAVFWMLVASLVIVIFMVIFVLIDVAHAESFDTCIAKCKTDVMYIDECIKDERKHWETNTSNINLKHACLDLIRNERFACRSICEKQLISQSYTLDYYDTQVRHFPQTIQ